MKNLRLAVLALAMFAILVPAQLVSAHSEAVDGKISALIHVDPEDKPQAGKVNKIHVYFNDEDSRFTVEGCFCKIKINQGSKTILNNDLEPAGPKTGTAQVYLPQDNYSYAVVVSGTPKTAGFFQQFKLNFDIDVGTPALVPTTPKNNNSTVLIIGGLLLISAITALAVVRKRFKVKDHSNYE